MPSAVVGKKLSTKLAKPSPLYQKTQLCKFHATSRCKRGSHCLFAHSEKELRATPDLFRTRLCPSIGNCDNPFCTYAHNESELRPTVVPEIITAAPEGHHEEPRPDQLLTNAPMSSLMGLQNEDMPPVDNRIEPQQTLKQVQAMVQHAEELVFSSSHSPAAVEEFHTVVRKAQILMENMVKQAKAEETTKPKPRGLPAPIPDLCTAKAQQQPQPQKAAPHLVYAKPATAVPVAIPKSMMFLIPVKPINGTAAQPVLPAVAGPVPAPMVDLAAPLVVEDQIAPMIGPIFDPTFVKKRDEQTVLQMSKHKAWLGAPSMESLLDLGEDFYRMATEEPPENDDKNNGFFGDTDDEDWEWQPMFKDHGDETTDETESKSAFSCGDETASTMEPWGDETSSTVGPSGDDALEVDMSVKNTFFELVPTGPMETHGALRRTKSATF